MNGGIYTITCLIDDKVYVGSAKNLGTRWGEHQGMLNSGKHFNRHLQHAWNKHGSNKFKYTVIEQLGVYNRTIYYERENDWIDTLRFEGVILYNIARAEGGWGPETHLRKGEICAKISASVKIALADPVVKQKMINAKKGKPLSDQHKENTSLGLIGIPKSESACRNMRTAQKLWAASNPQVALRMAEIGRRNVGRTPINAVTYTVDDVKYPSGSAALRALGITGRQLTKMVKEGRAHRD